MYEVLKDKGVTMLELPYIEFEREAFINVFLNWCSTMLVLPAKLLPVK